MMSVSPSATTTMDSGAKLQLRIMEGSARTVALVLWRKLEFKLSNQRLTCSSVWTETWLNHYGQVIPHQFAIGIREGKVRGIALVTRGIGQNAGRFALNTRHLGTAGELESESVCVEYNTLLVGPEDRIEFIHALWKWVSEKTNCDEFRIDGFATASIEPLLALSPQTEVERKTCYYHDLRPSRDSGGDPMTRLGRHTRERIRRTWRELGQVNCEWAETASSAERLFHKMVVLHQARWNAVGKAGVYSSRRFRDFHLELLNRLVPLGLMTIVGLMSGNHLIGACQVLFDNRRGLLYQCGWERGAGRVSHGLALDYQCICECLKRGYDEVDFLAGNSEHKRRLSTDKAELAWVVWRRPNFKNSMIHTLRRIKMATQRYCRFFPVKSPHSPVADQ